MSVCLSSCRTYINLLSDSESGSEHDSYEDRNVQQAIEASLHDFRYIFTFSFHIVVLYFCFRAVSEGDDELATSSDVKSVLVNHFSQLHLCTDADDANRVVVRRKHIWRDTLRAFSRSTFDCRKSVHVIFVGEEAADAGGPRREFFHLALEAMANDGQMFHGPSDRRSFVHNMQAVATRRFFYGGMLIALSLANGGPGFPCLAKPVFNYLCYGLGLKVQPEIEDIPDIEIREKLEKVF